MLTTAPAPCLFAPRRTTTAGSPCLRPRLVALAAQQSGGPRGRRTPRPIPSRDPDWTTTGEVSDAEDEAPLRGTDVLHALRRAVAQKGAGAAQKGKKRRPPGGRREQSVVARDGVVSDDVRPIEIRNEWEGRIDELERKIQELRAQYHY